MIAIAIIGAALAGLVAGWLLGSYRGPDGHEAPGPRSVQVIPSDEDVSVHERWTWPDWAAAHCPVCGYRRQSCVCEKGKL